MEVIIYLKNYINVHFLRLRIYMGQFVIPFLVLGSNNCENVLGFQENFRYPLFVFILLIHSLIPHLEVIA